MAIELLKRVGEEIPEDLDGALAQADKVENVEEAEIIETPPPAAPGTTPGLGTEEVKGAGDVPHPGLGDDDKKAEDAGAEAKDEAADPDAPDPRPHCDKSSMVRR